MKAALVTADERFRQGCERKYFVSGAGSLMKRLDRRV